MKNFTSWNLGYKELEEEKVFLKFVGNAEGGSVKESLWKGK